MKKTFLSCFTLIFGVIFLAPVFAQRSPDQFFGIEVGGDRLLVPYPRIVDYFRYLAEGSPRMKLNVEGQSTLGNPMVLVAISSEENIRRLDALMEINRKLSNPDRVSPQELPELIGQARVFVLITASLHASEIGASQMAMILAHHLASSSEPKVKEMLDRVVILLMPSINPDGHIMVCDWYKKYLGTPYEGGRMPYLYHHYAGHDNNRDFFMLNLKESRVLNAVLHHRYFPHVFLDMHQMGNDGPRIFVPPFKDPVNTNLSPLMLREVQLLGAAMALKLQEAGKRGVADSYGFDAYWPGGTKNTAWYKNVVGLLSELASVRVASPVFVDPSELHGGGKGLPEYKPQINFPDPWPGGWWKLKDIVEYGRIACEALIETAAQNRETFIGNFVRLGQENIQRGKNEAPYAYVIPSEQWDPPEALSLLAKLLEHGVRLYRLKDDWIADRRIHARGSTVIPLDQPYRAFIKTMMECQRYPEIRLSAGGPVLEPYDCTGWTLPLLMNVKTDTVETPLANAILEPIVSLEFPQQNSISSGNYYCFPVRFNRTFMVVNRLLAKGVRLFRSMAQGVAAAGDFLLSTSEISEELLRTSCAGSDFSPAKVALPVGGKLQRVLAPRLAIYQSYLPSADEGWTRWILDEYAFPYAVLHNHDFLDKNFAAKYDVLIFPSQSRQIIVEGKDNADRPAPFFPRPYQGGIGKKGVDALKEFVKRGGRLILLDAAWELAQKDFELPLSNVLSGGSVKLYCPGSILRIHLDTHDPLGWGLEPESIIYFTGGAAFLAGNPDDQRIQRRIVGRFHQTPPHLLSGYLEGGEVLNNAVTAVRFESETGQVVILGGRVQYRAQTTATFKLLFNAIFLP